MAARTSYRWALHPEVGDVATRHLTDSAYTGLDYAQTLAEHAHGGPGQTFRKAEGWSAVTVEDIADREGVSPATVRRRINRARKELFRDISDDAIDKRVQRRQQRRQYPPRTCKQPGCKHHLNPDSRSSRLYCEEHATTAHRVRRHRQQSAETPTS